MVIALPSHMLTLWARLQRHSCQSGRHQRINAGITFATAHVDWLRTFIEGDAVEQHITFFLGCGLCLSKEGLILCNFVLKSYNIVASYWPSLTIICPEGTLLANESTITAGMDPCALDLRTVNKVSKILSSVRSPFGADSAGTWKQLTSGILVRLHHSRYFLLSLHW